MKQDISFLSLSPLSAERSIAEQRRGTSSGSRPRRIQNLCSRIKIACSNQYYESQPCCNNSRKGRCHPPPHLNYLHTELHKISPKRKTEKNGTGRSSTLSCATCKRQVFVRFANRTRCKSIACALAATTSKQTTTTTTNPSFSSVAKDNYDQPRPMYKASDRDTKNCIILLPWDQTTDCQLLVPSVGSKHILSVT